MLLALDGSGIACHEAWYVGDTALDMECARNAGCRGVLLGARALEEDSFARFPPDLHFAGCAALAGHIRGL
jgi:phosphoglycolate phosphatase